MSPYYGQCMKRQLEEEDELKIVAMFSEHEIERQDDGVAILKSSSKGRLEIFQ
jgi:hypothetical protein